MSVDRDKVVSVHEAGHAVAAWYCTIVGEVQTATIDPSPVMWGGPFLGGYVTHWILAKATHACWCGAVIDLAGFAAEAMVLGAARTSPSSEDLLSALDNVRHGGPDFPWSEGKAGEDIDFTRYFAKGIADVEANGLRASYRMARFVLGAHEARLATLADRLRAVRTMQSKQIEAVLGPRSAIVALGHVSFRGRFIAGGADDANVVAQGLMDRIAGRIRRVAASLGVD